MPEDFTIQHAQAVAKSAQRALNAAVAGEDGALLEAQLSFQAANIILQIVVAQ